MEEISIKTKNFSISLSTKRREELISITDRIIDFVKIAQITSGIVKIFIPHTTAALIISQNANPDVLTDINTILTELITKKSLLNIEGNSDAHFKSSLFGVNVEVPIENSKINLGEWQGIFFYEFDGPRSRKIKIQVWGS